jgi:thiol-disulfide isomerase/thioredoxin
MQGVKLVGLKLAGFITAGVAIAASLAGCTTLNGTGDKGYLSGDGLVSVIVPADRGEPISVQGKGLQDEPLSLDALRGKVTVINVWGSWCAECHSEMPDLVAVANAADPEQVSFLGINTRDPSQAPAQGFVRDYDVPYPSLYDPDGTALLAFAGEVILRATPSTLVLDRRGRVAASIVGKIPTQQTLRDVIDEIVAEDG